MKMQPAIRILAFAAAALLAANAAAQTSTGQIAGTILDQTGAVIPGAYVRITNTETDELVREIQSNEVGRFSAPLLRPGVYSVAAEVEGFKQRVQSDIQLRVDDALNLRLTLEPGLVTEQVTVEALAVQLEETTHSIGQVVGETTIQKLPLNGRNYLDLGNLTAGTVPNARSRDKTYSAYGNRGYQNAYLLDGARNVNYLRGLDNRQRDAMRPSLEAVEEFKVNTSNFSAEYGASAGAVGQCRHQGRNQRISRLGFLVPAQRQTLTPGTTSRPRPSSTRSTFNIRPAARRAGRSSRTACFGIPHTSARTSLRARR